ncbi:MAG: phosphate ABC transporter substrate-binding protein, partial [Roseimicrobium sp.]
HAQAAAPSAAQVKPATIQGIWMMGQSLCDGSESLPLVTPMDTGFGNYSFARGVRTWIAGDNAATPEKRPEEQFAFVPLKAAVYGSLGETIANGMADSIKAAMLLSGNRNSPDALPRQKNGPPNFLVAYAGQGGRQIQELAKADLSTDPRTPENRRHGGGYYKTSRDDVIRAMTQARAMGERFKMAAFCWMQGEANGGPTGGIKPTRWDDEMPRPQGQEWYRDQLIAYRKQWSDDVCFITGQRNEIPMFTYQTLGPAGEAQLMAADKDPHIYMVGPHYAMPSALNSRRPGGIYGDPIHLSADAERWLGQQFGKVIHAVRYAGGDWEPLRPKKASVETGRMSVLVEFNVPHPPLVLDETFLPRQESAMSGGFSSLHGFQLRDGQGVAYPITAVEVDGATRLRLRFASPLPTQAKLRINYGHPNAGELGTIAAFRAGPVVEGQPTMEMIIGGSPVANLKPLSDEGAFFASNTAPGRATTRVPIRKVITENGDTFLRFETRELRDGVAFNAGQTVIAQRPFTYGNLRDSDVTGPESPHRFGDAGYGTRVGQPYPAWNWCVLFTGFPVEE